MQILGIDIGGSGIKGALVDTMSGALVTERFRLPTPQPSIPEEVAEVIAKITHEFNWNGPIGATFPAIVKEGVIWSAANVDESWIGMDGRALFEAKTGSPVTIINDADAAGIAEMTFGAGKDHRGVVIMITLGTGIGTALFANGQLFPNAELGHLEIRGKDAEKRASDKARQEKELSWEKWAEKVDEYLGVLENLFSPDLFIIGGGVSKKSERFLPLLNRRAEIVPAAFLNDSGMIGAAMAARPIG
ncbi:MAG TPA: ROK family protein [Phototrophicaceae bacterium]|nr:ROK family protein [Phototrophicaceae bacterium]